MTTEKGKMKGGVDLNDQGTNDAKIKMFEDIISEMKKKSDNMEYEA